MIYVGRECLSDVLMTTNEGAVIVNQTIICTEAEKKDEGQREK